VFVRARAPRERCVDPAIEATLRAAAPWQPSRGRGDGQQLIVRPTDLREKVRRSPTRHLVVFVVDSSRSMGARRRMAATKGMVLSLLVDAYQKRDLVGLVAFGGTTARVVLPPTRSVRVAARLLSDLPVGGLTPLAHGLAAAGHLVTTARRRDPTVRPVVVLLTDGRSNVPLHPRGDPHRDALRVVARLAASGVAGLVVDTESGPVKLGRARDLARAWKSDVRTLDDLRGRRLPDAIRRALLAG
jgi:magnesium chelatase subunit D